MLLSLLATCMALHEPPGEDVVMFTLESVVSWPEFDPSVKPQRGDVDQQASSSNFGQISILRQVSL